MITSKRYEYLHKLGEGHSAKVYKYRDLKSQQIVTYREYKNDVNYLNDEVAILCRLEHPSIPSFVDSWTTSTENGLSGVIVLSFARGEILHDIIRSRRNVTINQERMFEQLFSAIAHIHALNIMHRDIKPENIIYDSFTEKLTLIDWTYAQEVKDCSKSRGSMNYAAPEILFGYKYYGLENDIWSLGVVIYLFYTRIFPYKLDSEPDYDNDLLPAEIKSLLMRIFVYYEKRATIGEIQQVTMPKAYVSTK